MQDFRTRIDPPKWGLTVLGGVESILEPHEVRRSPPARSISPSVAWFLDFTPPGSLSLRHFSRAVPGPQAARRADARDDYLRRQGRGLPTFMRPGFGAAGAGSSSAAARAEDDGGSSTPSEFPGGTCHSPPPRVPTFPCEPSLTPAAPRLLPSVPLFPQGTPARTRSRGTSAPSATRPT